MSQPVQMVKFQNIGQFRSTVKGYTRAMEVVDTMPTTVEVFGTTKLHGTHGAICFSKDHIWCQSRERVLTEEKDNAGFCKYVNSIMPELTKAHEAMALADDEILAVYGEWCGNKIAKGTAIAKLSKKFFAYEAAICKSLDEPVILAGSEYNHSYDWLKENHFTFVMGAWMPFDCVQVGGKFRFTVDFTKPLEMLESMQKITNQVEQECPVAKQYGEVGIGEGIVWYYDMDGVRWRFKIKGDKHASHGPRIRTPEEEEALRVLTAFATEHCCTMSRLNQAWDEVINEKNGGLPDIKKTGEFVKWIVKDTIKEETDLIKENGFDQRALNRVITFIGRNWFIDKLDEDANLKAHTDSVKE